MDLLTQHLDNLAPLDHRGSTFGAETENKASEWDTSIRPFDHSKDKPTTDWQLPTATETATGESCWDFRFKLDIPEFHGRINQIRVGVGDDNLFASFNPERQMDVD
ncbi:hypothetical protein Fot_10832 [Forsythia ovata]|uniref:Uncharacterized protein n=1 Tax=Forsythia ovata TaxID=205694 RepID=A0ABD1WIB6_9LAMI